MKKSILFILIIVFICSVLFTLVACAEKPHKHIWSEEWTYDDNNHWHKCSSCDEIKDKTTHTYANDVCFCGQEEIIESTEGLVYSLSEDGSYAICKGFSQNALKVANVIITNRYQSKPVKVIAEMAFYNCQEIKSVTLPHSIVNIETGAFGLSWGLASITIPNSVEYIGQYAFFSSPSGSAANTFTIYCEVASMPSGWDNEWNFTNGPVVWDCKNNEVANDGYIYTVIDGLRYSLKDNAATIAVQSSTLVENVYFPNYVTYKCIKYSVTKIGEGAFNYCSRLKSITIPNSITSIGQFAFSANCEIEIIFYQGTMAEWKEIVNESNDTNFITIICTDGKLDKNDNVIE